MVDFHERRLTALVSDCFDMVSSSMVRGFRKLLSKEPHRMQQVLTISSIMTFTAVSAVAGEEPQYTLTHQSIRIGSRHAVLCG